MRLFRFLRPSPVEDAAASLYGQAVAQAREPGFYGAGGVPDTLDGRFDMVCLHVFLVLRRLKRDGDAGVELGQRLFDRMFADLEMNMRELGVSDYGIGHRVKAMAAAFYGRIAAYEEGLAGGEAALRQALARNLFGTAEPDSATLERTARYVAAAAASLDRQASGSIAAGSVAFPHWQAEAARHG
jgi:cytochrome b pre-mRNA-processing protein 3